MYGLINEAETIITETGRQTNTRDAALNMAAQKIEHYEIATYGRLQQLALRPGLNKAAAILEKTLNEQQETGIFFMQKDGGKTCHIPAKEM